MGIEGQGAGRKGGWLFEGDVSVLRVLLKPFKNSRQRNL